MRAEKTPQTELNEKSKVVRSCEVQLLPPSHSAAQQSDRSTPTLTELERESRVTHRVMCVCNQTAKTEESSFLQQHNTDNMFDAMALAQDRKEGKRCVCFGK